MLNGLNNNYKEKISTEYAFEKENKKTQKIKADEKLRKSEKTKTEEKENGLDEKQMKRLEQVIEEANQKMKLKRKSFEYSVDEQTNRIAIVVRDQETDEVIKEIPSEETLDMLAKIQEIAGLVFDQKF